MGEIGISLDSLSPKPPKPTPKKRKKKKRPKSASTSPQQTRRRALITSILVGSVAVHAVGLGLFGLWTVAKHFTRPEARFEMKKAVRIPPKTPEHRMNVAQHEAMAPKPTFNDKLVSTRPIDFALPDLPEVNMDQMLPLDPSELISDQVSGLVGSAALGSGLGESFGGGGGTGKGMNFFGLEAEGERILLLFDVSASVVNKADASGLPLERLQEETVKLIGTLPLGAQFSMIQFTGNYMPFTDELVAATPGNKETAAAWVEEKWVTKGSMSASTSGVVSNLHGLVGVMEKAIAMRPDVIFLLSDASFQWRPEGGGVSDIPYDEIRGVFEKLESESAGRISVQFLAFQPRDDDVKEWRRILRKVDGEFRELE